MFEHTFEAGGFVWHVVTCGESYVSLRIAYGDGIVSAEALQAALEWLQVNVLHFHAEDALHGLTGDSLVAHRVMREESAKHTEEVCLRAIASPFIPDHLRKYAEAELAQVQTWRLSTARIKAMRRDIQKNRESIVAHLCDRDGLFCRRCGTSEQMTVDHIQPLTKGGDNSLGNLQLLCGSCNSQKGNR